MKRTHHFRKIHLLVIALSLLMGGFVFNSCEELKTKKPRAEQAAKGRVHFQQYCTACHGEDGKGLVVDSLDRQPRDLTQIVKSRKSDKFPVAYVVKKIDGRNEVKAHGPRDMPVWGAVFTVEEDLNPDELKGKMGELIAYLMSIQEY